MQAVTLSCWTLPCSSQQQSEQRPQVLHLQPKGQVQNKHSTPQAMLAGTQHPWCSSLGFGIAPSSAPSQRCRAVTARAGSQTGVWASDVTSDVFKETLNTFKVNLMTSCYPEKAKYRKNKDLTCTCIYYGQLMLTECFALILDLH